MTAGDLLQLLLAASVLALLGANVVMEISSPQRESSCGGCSDGLVSSADLLKNDTDLTSDLDHTNSTDTWNFKQVAGSPGFTLYPDLSDLVLYTEYRVHEKAKRNIV